MPRVPTVQGPRVQERALQGGFDQTRPVPGAFEGNQALAQATERAASQISSAADRIAQRQAQETAWRVENSIQSDFLAFDDAQRRSRQGAAATGYAADVEQWWAEAKLKHGPDLTPEAQRIVNRSLANARLQSVAGASRWEAAEITRAEKEAYNASQAAEVHRAALSGDPNTAAASKEFIRQRVYRHGAVNNWTTEQVQEEVRRWTSQMHTRLIDTLMDTSPADARAYFEANRDDIDTSLHARADRAIRDAETTQQARVTVDRMAHLPVGEQLAQIREIQDDAVREKARQFARQDEADRNLSDTRVQTRAANDIWQQVANGASMEQLPPSVLADMSGSDRIQVNKYYEAMAEAKRRAALGLDIQTDPEVYNAILDDSLNNPREFANLDLNRFRYQLSNADMNRLRDMQRKTQNPKDAQTAQQLLQAFFQEHNLMGSKKARVTRRGELQAAFFDAVQEFSETEKRAPTRAEQQGILSRLWAEQSGLLWGTSSTRWMDVRGDPQAEQRFLQRLAVPAQDRARLIRRFQEQSGFTPSDEEIREAYRIELGLPDRAD